MERYKIFIHQKEFRWSIIWSFLLLFFSLYMNYLLSTYATENASNAVTDIVLSNIRVFDVDWIFLYGPLIFWAFIGFICLKNPHKIPFTIKSIALFVLIRSVFISLTHIGPFTSQLSVNSEALEYFNFGGDLFFSAHTGLPFLMALVFWNYPTLRKLFIITSIFFGIVVLLGHFHYSIDVLAAFFITHTIHHLAEMFFPEDRRIFIHGLETIATHKTEKE